MIDDTERPDEPQDAPGEEPPASEEQAPPEEPIAPDEEGRSQPEEPGEDSGEEDAVHEAAATTEAEAQEATDELVEAADETTAATDGEEPAAGPTEPEFVEERPREKSEIPGAHLEVDIVPEGFDPLGREALAEEGLDVHDIEVPEEAPAVTEDEVSEPEPAPEARPQAVIDLAAGARYRATGKRKTAVARVILRPGTGKYTINGRPLDDHFPRPTLQRNIRQPLETVGYDARMDVVAKLHGGGVSAQAGALRHGISRALIEADPNLRAELKRRGFLTRDARVKERKKAGLKKARKRPQFSKR